MSPQKRTSTERQRVPTTPRYAPSTPHAVRALQERSGAKNRSTQKLRALEDAGRADSARGILRRLAKLTAPTAKKRSLSPGKENQPPESLRSLGSDNDGNFLKRPRVGLDIDDSLESSTVLSAAHEEQDSEVLQEPTLSILPDDDPEKSVKQTPNMALNATEGAGEPLEPRLDGPWQTAPSRMATPGTRRGGAAEADMTILSEVGRRAWDEEDTGRLSRYSFGNIRMSDFGSELEIRRESDGVGLVKRLAPDPDSAADDGVASEEERIDIGGETENLEGLRGSPVASLVDDNTLQVPPLDEGFELDLPVDVLPTPDGVADTTSTGTERQSQVGYEWRERREDGERPLNGPGVLPSPDTRLEADTDADTRPAAAHAPRRRRKRVKMTQSGQTIPCLPASLIKRVALDAQDRLGNRKPRLGQDHVRALEQATEWFFEQVGADLVAYSDHARRKHRIDRSDVEMLMNRQRLLQGEGELECVVGDLLPEDARPEL